MKDLWDSLSEYLKSRLKTPLYGVFTFWWIGWLSD